MLYGSEEHLKMLKEDVAREVYTIVKLEGYDPSLIKKWVDLIEHATMISVMHEALHS